MPQLNPSPWLLIFILAWVFFLFIFLNKTFNSYIPDSPTTKMEKYQPPNWNWPWY